MARGGKRENAGRKPGSTAKVDGELKSKLTDIAKLHTEDAMGALVSVMGDYEAPHAARVMAANSILDRGWGKAPQSIEHKGEAGGVAERLAAALARTMEGNQDGEERPHRRPARKRSARQAPRKGKRARA